MKRSITTLILAIFIGLAPAVFGGAPAQAGADASALLKSGQELLAAGKKVAALKAVHQAAFIIWQETPLHLQTVTLAARKATGYGMYQPRANNIYPAGRATILLYLEPKAYRLVRNAQGLYGFDLSMDLFLLNPSGKMLFGKENFLQTRQWSRRANQELFLNVTLTLNGAPPGNYIIKLLLKDNNGKSMVEARTPIRIK